MKRHGHLFEQIATFDNLLLAARKALRGKKDKRPVAAFYFHLEPELLRLQEELLEGTYVSRPYRSFMVYEPKPRKICAADIRDRVVHHAICNVLEPIFEAFSIYDSYACRKGKGTHRAIRRAQAFSRRSRYFLKLDVEKCFETVDHGRLKDLLARKFKDKRLLTLLGQIIDHPIPDGESGKGLPIGNLTSQYFANFYLGHLDHFVKDDLGVRFYLRYMDDMLLFGDNKAGLYSCLSKVRRFLRDRLLLHLKENAILLAPVAQGIPFLGFRVFSGLIRVQRSGWIRFVRKMRDRERAYLDGQMDEGTFVQSVQSLLGHIRHANTYHLRRNLFGTSQAMG